MLWKLSEDLGWGGGGSFATKVLSSPTMSGPSPSPVTMKVPNWVITAPALLWHSSKSKFEFEKHLLSLYVHYLTCGWTPEDRP